MTSLQDVMRLVFCALIINGVPCMNAAAVGPDAFPGAVIDTYDALPIIYGYLTPFVLNGNEYTGEDFFIRYIPTEIGPGHYCVSGSCLATNKDLGFINVLLGTPVIKA